MCKATLPLDEENFKKRNRIRKSGEIIVSYEYRCRPCSNLAARRRGNPNYVYTGGRGGKRLPIHHTGPEKGSILWKFFCT